MRPGHVRAYDDAMDELNRVLDELDARDHEDELRAEGYEEGYEAAVEAVEKVVNARGTAAAKIKALREMFEL